MRISERLERFVADGHMPGCALAVAKDGEPVGEWYCGEMAPGTPAGEATLWPRACMSTVYTAATIMALVERGELTLSMPVRSLLPSFVEGGRDAIRLRHLLTHTSGLARTAPGRLRDLLNAHADVNALIAEAYHYPLISPPGTAFTYTDHGYVLAAHMAEAATGRSFASLMRELVLPDLNDTHFPQPSALDGRIAHITGAPAGLMYNSRYWRELAHPALGVAATVRDLLRFGLMFAGKPSILSPASVRAMTTDQTGGHAAGAVMSSVYPPQARPWGIGFSIRGALGNGFEDMASHNAFDHLGAGGAILLVDPDASVTIAFASNLYIDADTDGFLRRISTVVNMVLAGWGY
jgi:CubicO group peptidase (beta-lactamase class C family)